MNENTNKIIEKLLREKKEEELEAYLKNLVCQIPGNSGLLVKLAMLETIIFEDKEQGIFYLKKALSIESNIEIILVLSELYWSLYGTIPEDIFLLLQNYEAKNNEEMSLLEYMKAFYFIDKSIVQYKLCLEKSINFCDKYVANYLELASYYINSKHFSEACLLLSRANANLTGFRRTSYDSSHDFLDITNYINEFIKGISNFEGGFYKINKMKQKAGCKVVL